MAQAVTFGMPDRFLGEDVAVAVVLKDSTVSEQDLRRYAGTRLANHKVPRRVIILGEIPKGATGKIQRIGLAKKLGLVEEVETIPVQAEQSLAPRTPLEKNIAMIWQKILDVPAVGVNITFRDAGGDSMLAILVHQQVEEQFKIQVPLVDLFNASTISDQAILVDRLLSAGTSLK